MRLHFRTSLRMAAIVVVCIGWNLNAQSVASLNALMKQRDAAIRQLQATSASQKADLFDKYANALDALLKQITAKGDLESALIVKSEIESARMKRTVGAGVLAALDSYRATLGKSVEGIEANTAASQSQIDAGYVRSLNQMKVDFTKAGNLDEAVAVDKEIKNVIAGTASASPIAAKSLLPPPSQPPSQPSARGGKSVSFEKPFEEEVTLPAGNYRPRETVIVGGPGENKGAEKPGTLHIISGTQFDSAALLARKGVLTADHALFKECTISADYGGSFQAKDSLFGECKFAKGGRWNMDYFSGRMTFENCVFSRFFAPDWRVHNLGARITHCTFHNVGFDPLVYVADAGKEVAMAPLLISQCKFVGCEIPESLFIATKDCVFEDCKFKAAKPKEKPPIATPIKVRAYVRDAATVTPPLPMCTYEILDPKGAPQGIGASLVYQSGGFLLKFQ